jgi:hypothetical protein
MLPEIQGTVPYLENKKTEEVRTIAGSGINPESVTNLYPFLW